MSSNPEISTRKRNCYVTPCKIVSTNDPIVDNVRISLNGEFDVNEDQNTENAGSKKQRLVPDLKSVELLSKEISVLSDINEYDSSNIYSCNNSEIRENASSFLSSTSLEEKRKILIKKFAVAANCIGMNDKVLQEFLTPLKEFVNTTKLGNQFGLILQNPPKRSLDFKDSFNNATGDLLKDFGFNLAKFSLLEILPMAHKFDQSLRMKNFMDY